MKIADAEKLALELIEEHLPGKNWRFRFDRANSRFGCCHDTLRLITLSKVLTELNDEDEVRNTILHEIAHALAGCEHHHDKVWKKKCVEIGARPQRCYSKFTVTTPDPKDPKYLLVCRNCGRTRRAWKKRYCSCGKCSNGVFNPEYVMECIPWTSTLEDEIEKELRKKEK